MKVERSHECASGAADECGTDDMLEHLEGAERCQCSWQQIVTRVSEFAGQTVGIAGSPGRCCKLNIYNVGANADQRLLLLFLQTCSVCQLQESTVFPLLNSSQMSVWKLM